MNILWGVKLSHFHARDTKEMLSVCPPISSPLVHLSVFQINFHTYGK